jgi:hypothetical protein
LRAHYARANFRPANSLDQASASAVSAKFLAKISDNNLAFDLNFKKFVVL